MLQPYCPNSVIILLSFLWLPSVLQPSKQTFAYEVTATDLAPSAGITPYNYLSVLNSLLHGRFSVVTQHATLLPLKTELIYTDLALIPG